MWIYSLGITLHNTIRPVSGQTNATVATGVSEPAAYSVVQKPKSTTATTINDKRFGAAGENCANNGRQRSGDDGRISAMMISNKSNATTLTPLPPLSPVSGGDGSSSVFRYNNNNYNNNPANHSENMVGVDGNSSTATLTSLDYVISAMCAPNLHQRASLMYLLNVSTHTISNYM